ncbi:MAG: PAS domain S-box protein [Thermodesulfobacteriota bacterium]|nr:PAS domain S-box protein [Thermodesulfobacteriota bacterium]
MDVQGKENKNQGSLTAYREVFHAINDSVIVHDTQDCNILDVNRKTCEMFGYSTDELKGLTIDGLIAGHPPFTQKKLKQWVQEAAKGQPQIFDWMAKTKDSRLFWVEINVKKAIIDGKDRMVMVLRNITDRRHEEEDLLKKIEIQETIIDTSPAFFVTINTEGKTIMMNKSMLDALGYMKNEVTGKDFMATFVPGKDRKKLSRVFQLLIKDNLPTLNKTHLLTKAGALLDIEWQGRPVFDKNSEFEYFFGLGNNITERIKTHKELYKRKLMYQGLFESTNDAIFLLKDARFIECNPRALEMFGCSYEQIIGKTPYQLSPGLQPDDKKSRKKSLEKIKSTLEEGPQVFRWRHTRYDGTAFETDISLNKINIEGKLFIQAIVRDVTERIQAQRRLEASEEKYRSIFDTNASAMLIFEEDTIISLANPTFEKMSGYSRNEVENKKSWTEFVSEKDLKRMRKYHVMRRTDPGSAPKTYEFTFIDRYGNARDTIIFVSIIPGTKQSVVSMQDITENKRMEQQISHAQKMEAIGTLAGGIAHNFNNLLAAIQGNTSLILIHTDKDKDNGMYRRLKNIEECVLSGAGLTRQLLGFARGGKYNVKSTNINKLVQKSAAIFGQTKKEITIHTELSENLWAAEVDPGQIEQVLMNIYINAWQAMPSGGDLYIETSNTQIDERDMQQYGVDPGKYIKTGVTDTGMGMDKTTRSKVFEPFFTTREMGNKGTGLGMASAYGVIKNHKGIIQVYSEKYKGTTFNIYLPATDAAIRIEKPDQERDTIHRGKGTILLVDDEEIIIEVGLHLLEDIGYRVLTARGGQEAITIYKKQMDSIDLVILDMIMPSMGGGETFDRLKELNPGIMVLLSSGYSIEGQASDIMERGCSDFIQKPFNMKALSEKIATILA